MATLVARDNSPAVDLTDMMRTRRSQALPRHTLFGSSLEALDEEEKSRARELALKAPIDPREFKRPGRFYLSSADRKKMKEMKVVEMSKSDFLRQQQEAVDTENAIRAIENDALRFKSPRKGQEIKNIKVDPDVLAETRNMNRVGLNVNNSFNYDKYGKKAPIHSYALIGDVLRPGMEFNDRAKAETEYTATHGLSSTYGYLPPPSRTRRPSPRSCVEVPANIRHLFGSRICDQLLSDSKIVEKTIDKQRVLRELAKRPSKVGAVPDMPKELKPEYESLGNAMRMNVFAGYNINHRDSTMKTSFTDSVHLRRYPDPDQFRYQRDELSTWAESNVIDMRMRKLWDQFQDLQRKTSRNWERRDTVQRPKKEAAAPATKAQKKKNVNKPKPEDKSEPVFEEVKFVTPPVTPPPDRVVLPKKKERDSEFWDFYDKGK